MTDRPHAKHQKYMLMSLTLWYRCRNPQPKVNAHWLYCDGINLRGFR
jgi:hypothetical protein